VSSNLIGAFSPDAWVNSESTQTGGSNFASEGGSNSESVKASGASLLNGFLLKPIKHKMASENSLSLSHTQNSKARRTRVNMVSIKEIARDRGIDEDLVLECLREFYDYTLNHDLPGLFRALDENNLGRVSERAHSIKGAAFNLALNEIGNCAQQIVIKSRAGETDGLRQLASSLEIQVAEIATFLEGLP